MSAARLDGRVVLVSGGTQGVGLAIAREAVEAGAAVAVTGRREDVGAAAVADLVGRGGRAVFVRADAGEVAACRDVVAAAAKALGPVDGLVNAAGLTTRGTLLDTTPALFEAHVAVNLAGPFFLMQAVVEGLVERGAPGAVVNVTTTSAHGGQAYLAAYSATKAGLVGLTRNAAHAHRWDRVRVNAVNLGWTDSEGEDAIQRRFHNAGDDWRERAGERLPMGRLGDPADAARLVVLLLSHDSGVVTGSVVDWDQQVIGGLD